jgi:hypothetical protein
MGSIPLPELTAIDRLVFRRAGCTEASVLRGEQANKLIKQHSSVLVFWHSAYKCYVANPSKSIGTLMVFAG